MACTCPSAGVPAVPGLGGGTTPRASRVSASRKDPTHSTSTVPLALPDNASLSSGMRFELRYWRPGITGNPVTCSRTEPRCKLVAATFPAERRRPFSTGGAAAGSSEFCQFVMSASPCTSPPNRFPLIEETRRRSGVTEKPAFTRPFRRNSFASDHSRSLAWIDPCVA